MKKIFRITVFLSLLLLVKSDVYDITSYGAKSGGDIVQPLLKAWEAACENTGRSKVVIPAGTWPLKEVGLHGPCRAPLELQVQGTVVASTNPASVSKGNDWFMIERVENFTLSGNGVFDGQGAPVAWKKSDRCSTVESCNRNPNSLSFYFVKNSIVKGITSKDSKLFHIMVYGCTNLTFSNIKIRAPETSPNTDGIHIGRSNGTTIIHSSFQTGDDCISIGDGSRDVNVTDVTCGPGHGISVGSLGKYKNEQPVDGIYVNNCTLTNTLNGVRIKTWAAAEPGAALNLRFENIIMNNVGYPMIIDQLYCPSGYCKFNPPSKVKISKVRFSGIRGTSRTPVIAYLVCSKSLPCEGVEIGNVNLQYTGKIGQAVTNCTNVKPSFFGTQVPKICGPPPPPATAASAASIAAASTTATTEF